ncbi:hypothetical protein [Ramlibacter tataouinensis]|uniref:Uncharacterized protein n=1 Tax=Ramlibacter tataouinensis (strain ATCC BAA-407 / DSM 14655 / LMG 21543 / TTB310) TaxID=365046 RepID=F5XXV1_RAMTT|nr:hypothetical protein [Ramlibacter tataouinensis]AEG93086.1 conserved hypothetical protein [Ramlibacter tataouinensis TTB310]
MRARTLVLIVAIAAVVLFALLNWQEFSRPTTLNLGWRTATAPLGLLLLGLLGLTLIAFLVSSASAHTRMLMESRQNAKALQAQRDLADKAEASRFTDLRQQLDNHLRETRQRETTAAAEFEKTMSNHQRELRNQLEQMQRSLSMRLGEMEARIDARLGHQQPMAAPAMGAAPVITPPRHTETVSSTEHVEPVLGRGEFTSSPRG